MPQNATGTGPNSRLTAKQRAAISALMSGASVSGAAKTAGVDRSTLHRWMRGHTAFHREMETLGDEAFLSVRHRLTGVAEKAVERLEIGILANDPALIGANAQLLEKLGVLRPLAPG